MKLGVVSDLHLPNQGKLPRPSTASDLMVLAGDIGVGLAGVSWASTVYQCPVVYVPGNHEYYSRIIDSFDAELRSYVAGSHVHLLQNDQVVLLGVRFLGTTLWSDFELEGNPDASMQAANHYINDFSCIATEDGELFTPTKAAERFHAAVAWLKARLAEPFLGPTVVVTHHLPSRRSVAPRYQGDFLSPAFASNLDDVVASSGAALWIHGHGHDSVDYMLGKTRVIANPKGYSGEERERETPAFRWDFTVNLGG